MSENLLNDQLPSAANQEAPGMPAGSSGVPEKFRDPQTGAIQVDKLLKSYLALERRMAGMVRLPAENDAEGLRGFHRALGVPDAPDGYSIQLRHPQLHVDPEVNAKLHAAGFTPAQAQLVYDLACDHVMPQVDDLVNGMNGRTEREKLVQHFGGEQRYREAARSLDAWGRANLPEGTFDALASSAKGVMALETMMKTGEPSLRRAEGNGGDEALTEEQLVKLMQDPRYWKRRDPEILDKVTQGFRRLYPG